MLQWNSDSPVCPATKSNSAVLCRAMLTMSLMMPDVGDDARGRLVADFA
jgi:hypothetical protein